MLNYTLCHWVVYIQNYQLYILYLRLSVMFLDCIPDRLSVISMGCPHARLSVIPMGGLYA